MQLHTSFGSPFAKPHRGSSRLCLFPTLSLNLSLTLDLGCWLRLLSTSSPVSRKKKNNRRNIVQPALSWQHTEGSGAF